MTFLVLGINHITANLEIRSKFAFDKEKTTKALERIADLGLAENAVIVSTCNRFEIYLQNSKISTDLNSPKNQQFIHNCKTWLAEFHNLPLTEIEPFLYQKQNNQAVIHLMQVACGLNSIILGENQILGQLKDALTFSENFYQSKGLKFHSILKNLFYKSFACAKKVRSSTEIGVSSLSIAYAMCQLIRLSFPELDKTKFLLIGAGQTIKMILQHLVKHNTSNIVVANRTLENIEKLQKQLNCNFKAINLTELEQNLIDADVVISATASPKALVTKESIEIIQPKRAFKSLLFLDFAVPNDIEQEVTNIQGVSLYNVDDVQHIINLNLDKRIQSVSQANEIIKIESDNFANWIKIHKSSSLICDYRRQSFNDCYNILSQAKIQNAEELSYKISQKLMHYPTLAIKQFAKEENNQALAEFIRLLEKEQN